MTDPKNIESKENSTAGHELMMKYINDELKPDEQWNAEQAIANSPLLSDAEEGLRLIRDKTQLPQITQSLNRRMRRKLKKRYGVNLQSNPRIFLLLIVTFLLLMILALCYIVILRLKAG